MNEIEKDQLKLEFKETIESNSGTWYSNLQFLGKGGAAVTYLMLATNGSNEGTTFALKIFRRVSKPERRDAFLKEVGFLRTCEHPCVMRVFDEGLYQDDCPFVVAEYLPRTLLDVIRSNNSSLVEKLSFSLQLLSSLNYLSELDDQVVHRDIKPKNIFVKGRSCVLGDFGLMKLVSDQSADEQAGEFMKQSVGPGMPFFHRTPDLVEYAKGESQLSVASDVFQMGLALAQLFTGRNPQKRAANNQHLSKVELEKLRFVPGMLGPQIADLIKNMLEFNPEKRISVRDALAVCSGLFITAAERSNALEGRIF
ncbi:MAG: protein kinase [Lacipirellulaceae bacterium]